MKEVKCALRKTNWLPVIYRCSIYSITLLSQVAFAVFFGLLGLFLALPLVVVSQVWLRELLVKDILNDWQPKKS
ncbi:MAG: hypothetical protein WBF90_09435 [Rivularia sp. (in: cyanobacteria)]